MRLGVDGYVDKAAGTQTQIGIVKRYPSVDFIVFGERIDKVELGFDFLPIGGFYGHRIAILYPASLVGIKRNINPYLGDIGQSKQGGGRCDEVTFARINLCHDTCLSSQYFNYLDGLLGVLHLLHGFNANIFVEKFSSFSGELLQKIHHIGIFH